MAVAPILGDTVSDVATLGQVLSGRYLVEEIVGQGSFGRVFRARDTATGATVALKEFIRTPGRADGFLRELGILFELKHPSVIDCQSLVMAGPFRYLVCEFMEGGSLRHQLEASGVTTAVLLRLLVSAAEGVAYAHGHNVIHRDLKPENILLARRGGELVAKVSDFGVSTLGTSMGARSCIGSPAYMAPEQFYDQYDARIDVYALGVIAYEILCGRRPFAGSPAQLMVAHIKREPEVPSWLPRSFARLLRKALAKKAEKRFPSAEAFASALSLALSTEGAALDRDSWPCQVAGTRAIGVTREDIYVSSAEQLVRLDRRGRLVEELPAVDDLHTADGFMLARRDKQLVLRGAFGDRTWKDVPCDMSLALSAEGTVAFSNDGGATAIDSGGRHELYRAHSGVTGLCFLGHEQTLSVVRSTENGSRLEFGGTAVDLPEPIAVLYGHPSRYEVVARSAADPSRLFLVRLGHVTAVRLVCGPLTCDGDSFYGVTDDGGLATINVASHRIARTRWQSPLAAVAAGSNRFVCATATGRVECLQ